MHSANIYRHSVRADALGSRLRGKGPSRYASCIIVGLEAIPSLKSLMEDRRRDYSEKGMAWDGVWAYLTADPQAPARRVPTTELDVAVSPNVTTRNADLPRLAYRN